MSQRAAHYMTAAAAAAALFPPAAAEKPLNEGESLRRSPLGAALLFICLIRHAERRRRRLEKQRQTLRNMRRERRDGTERRTGGLMRWNGQCGKQKRIEKRRSVFTYLL